MSGSLAPRLSELVSSGEDRLPLPGKGKTLTRWRRLAAIAAEDVALAKIFEGHTDALAIMAELAAPEPPAGSRWGTWAAEPPDARLSMTRSDQGIRLNGRKSWCSGADIVSHAVLTAWDSDGRQCLAAVELGQTGVRVTEDGWHAVGMGRARSGDVWFTDVPATMLGVPGSYLDRPGFWQGGAGIAACWYGGVVPFVDALRDKVIKRPDPHSAAHLGAADLAMTATRALLREAADWIDRNPDDSAQLVALRTRGAVEETVALVLAHAGRALGAGPLCRDPELAQRFADLPVFVRQSHAEADRAALGGLLSAANWSL